MLSPALLLLALIVAVSLLRARRAMPPPDGEPRCGRCAYIVRAVPTFICPECGSDLRDVGIIVRRTAQSPWVPFLLGASVWSILLIVAGSTLAEIMRRALPQWGAAAHTVTLTKPSSRTFQSVTINASGEYRLGPRAAADPFEPAAYAELLLNDGGIASLSGDLKRGQFSYRTPDGRTVSAPEELDTAAVLSWMKDVDIDTSAAGVRQEAAQIVLEIRSPPPNRTSRSYSQGGGGSPFGAFASGRRNWSANASGLAWDSIMPWALGLLSWLAGLHWLARRHGLVVARRHRA